MWLTNTSLDIKKRWNVIKRLHAITERSPLRAARSLYCHAYLAITHLFTALILARWGWANGKASLAGMCSGKDKLCIITVLNWGSYHMLNTPKCGYHKWKLILPSNFYELHIVIFSLAIWTQRQWEWNQLTAGHLSQRIPLVGSSEERKWPLRGHRLRCVERHSNPLNKSV